VITGAVVCPIDELASAPSQSDTWAEWNAHGYSQQNTVATEVFIFIQEWWLKSRILTYLAWQSHQSSGLYLVITSIPSILAFQGKIRPVIFSIGSGELAALVVDIGK
jgi:hypothetical protein